jgi:oligopeptide transport system substrate-binding protein
MMRHRLFPTYCFLPRLAVTLGFGGCLLLLAACGQRETPVDDGVRTQTLLLGNLAEPKDLDPQILDAFTDMNIAAALFEGLTALDEKTGTPIPAAAERWEISADGLVYTFHLRPNAKWSDGTPLTSQDFAYSFQRILTPAFAASYSYMLWPIKNAEAFNAGKITDFGQVGVATPDAATLRVTLERPTAYLPALAAHNTWYPVPKSALDKNGGMLQHGSHWTRPGNLVGNGPFTLTEWNPNSRITVEKNQHYWDAATVRLNRIRFLPIESAEVEERNFRAGQMHVTWDLPSSKVVAYQTEKSPQLRIDPLLSLYYLNFNLKKPPFDNMMVRRAFSLALDRAALSRSVLNGVLPPAYSFVPPGCGDYTSTGPIEENIATARNLLKAAGYPEGRGLPPIALQVLNDLRQPKLAEAAQAMWSRELGVNVTIEMNEQKVWLQNQQSMNHQVAFLGWTADFPDPITFLSLAQTDNGQNWSGWSNRDYDQLLKQAESSADPAQRKHFLQIAEGLMLAECPVAPLVYRSRTFLLHPAVKNWEPAVVGIHLYKNVYLQGP